MKSIEGGCLCGAVAFVIPDDLAYAGYCHCSECRRFSGSAFSAFGGISAARFCILRGEGEITFYTKSASTVLAFCRICGSSVSASKPGRDMIHRRLGTLSGSPSLLPQAHSQVGSKAAWYAICDDLPQFKAARLNAQAPPK